MSMCFGIPDFYINAYVYTCDYVCKHMFVIV